MYVVGYHLPSIGTFDLENDYQSIQIVFELSQEKFYIFLKPKSFSSQLD